MQVKDCMKNNVYSVSPTTTITEASNIFASKHIGSLPVVDRQGKLVGIIQLSDLLELVMPDFFKLVDGFDFVRSFGAIEERKPSDEILLRPINNLMQPPISVEVDSGLLRVFSLLRKHEIHDLPVVDKNGILVGIVSRVDVGTAILANWNAAKTGEA